MKLKKTFKTEINYEKVIIILFIITVLIVGYFIYQDMNTSSEEGKNINYVENNSITYPIKNKENLTRDLKEITEYYENNISQK